MNRSAQDTAENTMQALTASPSIVVGHVCRVTDDGVAMVEFPGNSDGPLPARAIMQIDVSEEPAMGLLPVLLAFADTEMRSPIIVGIVRDSFVSPQVAVSENSGESDASTKVIEARGKLELRCGKSSMQLNQNGKILLQGVQIVSRAKEKNRIKGSSVAIN